MKISPLAILCAYKAVFFAADVSVDAADVVAGRSDTSTSRLIKPTSFLSKFQVDNESSISRNGYEEVTRPDDLRKPLNVASAVTVTHNFLSKDETSLFRLNENKYQRKSVFNRTLGGAYLPRSFLHKLVDVGGQQCASEDYENTLPAGVHILTNHVTETSDPHVDCNPTTLESIENDVAVVFLNSNPDATFFVEDEGYPIEEGMLITFPGGSVPHHIEMKKEDGGSVHMLGPFEVGGSHGPVGVFLAGKQSAKAKIKPRRMLEVDGSEQGGTTITSTNNIAGEITVTGYRDGIDSNGATNHTLEVAYRLEGLSGLNCSAINCFFSADIFKNQPNFCESGNIGQIMNSTTGDAAGSQTFLEITSLSLLDDINQTLDDVDLQLQSEIMSLIENINIDIPDVIEGQMYINIGKPVTYFFDTPMALYGLDERMLACSAFTEVKSAAEEDTTSGARSYRVALWTIAVFVSSFIALVACL